MENKTRRIILSVILAFILTGILFIIGVPLAFAGVPMAYFPPTLPTSLVFVNNPGLMSRFILIILLINILMESTIIYGILALTKGRKKAKYIFICIFEILIFETLYYLTGGMGIYILSLLNVISTSILAPVYIIVQVLGSALIIYWNYRLYRNSKG